MHNLHNTCQAGFYGEELIERTFRDLEPQLQLLERSPTFDVELGLEGQYAQPSQQLSGWIL